ncbi:hypothetical protein IAT38_005725 [Cryptococcus sp. DSM 104549]
MPPLPPAAAAAAASLTSLSPLPKEVIDMIFQAYIDTTPLSSPHFQDLLCLDRRTHNRNVQRLYDKVTLHAGNARKFYEGIEGINALRRRERRWTEPELADFFVEPKNGGDCRREGTEEVWVTGMLSLPDGCPIRYPKHYLIRRVNQISFTDWTALSCTAGALQVFASWLETAGDVWDAQDVDRPPPATLFQHVESVDGAGKNVCLIFHHDLVDSMLTLRDLP